MMFFHSHIDRYYCFLPYIEEEEKNKTEQAFLTLAPFFVFIPGLVNLIAELLRTLFFLQTQSKEANLYKERKAKLVERLKAHNYGAAAANEDYE